MDDVRFEVISAEEAENLEYAPRGKSSRWAPMAEALKKGEPVKLYGDARTVSKAVSYLRPKVGKLTYRTLADKSATVIMRVDQSKAA